MLSNMKTGTKVLVSLLFASAVLLGVGAFSWHGADLIAARLDETANQKIPSLVAQARIGDSHGALETALWILTSSRSTPASRLEAAATVKSAIEEIDQSAKIYEAMPHHVETLVLWKSWKDAYTAWRPSVERVASLIGERDRLLAGGRSKNDPAVAALDGEAWEAFQRGLAFHEKAEVGIDAITLKTRDDAIKAGAAGREAAHTMVTTIAIVTLAAAAVLILLSIFLTRRIGGTVKALIEEAARLRDAVAAGNLEFRGEAQRLDVEFRPIVEGMNETMEAFERPIRMTAECVASIGQGKIPPKITEAYQGDFDLIKSSLNDCIDAVNLLVSDAAALAEAAVAGQLSNRADASRHQGDFRKVVDGVNKTLDAVIAPVTEAIEVLERLSQRDLRARVSSNYPGDHARIKDSLNATGEALQEAMVQVAAAVEQVSSASTQIASSSQAVAAGASEQAASLQQTTSSLEAVAAMTKQSADNAAHANALTQTARTAATDGAGSVEQMQGAMSKIKASAEGTSQIIKDINDIAFQTNLLALNAAVEAARAGEAGRGFAVVAEEVRSLALRAKEAAMKTEELIRESVKQAGEGEATSRLVAGKLGEIVAGIGKVTEIVSEIAAASKEQSAGIDQVNRAVTEMDKVTQQNAASAEESSSAASELNGQAEELAAMVGAFQLERGASRKAALKRPDAPAKGPAARRALVAATSGSRPPAPRFNGKATIEDRFPMDAETELVDF